ncbi:MAG: hypothetical protein MAG795_00321 [Candidatus Woesearchaeota archaeon]|nr:hypothetical protein [Candidatus Woesearchaeota archaeon]
MAQGDYDLLPHQDIKRLRKQIKELKSQAGKDTVKPDSLQNSINNLNDSINALIMIFKEASKNIKSGTGNTTHEHLGDMNSHLVNLNEQMEQLLKHNEEIAKGILVMANLIKENQTGANLRPRARPANNNRPRPVPRVPRPPQKNQRVPLPSFEDESI